MSLDAGELDSTKVTTTLQTEGSDETLNLRTTSRTNSQLCAYANKIEVEYARLLVGLLFGDLGALHLPTYDVFPYIILFGEVEELPDLCRTLRAETLGEDVVGQSRDLSLTLLDNDEREDGNIGSDNASTNGLARTLPSAARAVAGVAC